jgi:hypothetical protein
MENNILLKPLKDFYTNQQNLEVLLIILINKNRENIINYINNLVENEFKKKEIIDNLKYKKISLRLIDWFVTNYCKKNKICIKKNYKDKIIHINIYDSYKSNLKAFSKKIFDPFRRKEQIFLNYKKNNNSYTINFSNNINNNKYIETTIGQLNFFKWVIENDIYNYIIFHKYTIEKDMIKSQRENNNKKLDTKNLITKIVKDHNGNDKLITRKKRNELSKSKTTNINLNPGKRVIYFD